MHHYCRGCANEAAVNLLDAWRDSLESTDTQHNLGIVITGPRQSGKSYLAKFMAQHLNGCLIAPSTLPTMLQDELKKNRYILDNAEQETASNLIRFINQCQQTQSAFIIAGQGLPGSWGQTKDTKTSLNDLETRLLALPEAKLEHPDENLLADALTVFLKQCGIRIKDEISLYTATQLKRSFSAMTAIGQAIEAEILTNHTPIDKTTINRLLNETDGIKLGN